MKTLRNNKIPFYTDLQKRAQIRKCAGELHRGTGWLYEDAIMRADENAEIPEAYFAVNNGGSPAVQSKACLSKDAYDKVTRMAKARQSLTGREGTKTGVMRWLEDEILSRYARGEYERKRQEHGSIQIIVPASMHEKMVKLFPRKFIPEREEWSGGIAKHIRKVIRGFTVEDFPEERVRKLYEEFVSETSGLHPYTEKNKEALGGKNLRPFAVGLHEKENEILDAIGRGRYGAKAAICYYAYKLAYEKATLRQADKQSIKRTAKEPEVPHACGMELPEPYNSMKPRNVPEIVQKELRKDVSALKIDVGLLKNTQKQLVYAVKRLNERCFSKKRPVWWFHVLVIWTVATVLITLGIVSLVN